ncbi:MAG: 2-nitropropane dioxygenase [Herminiimonas sp.]|nr:2-nitropropane dioxygenase [Herminiimonas sp.]
MTLADLFAHPIIQAPMAGGATTPELVAAVSNAGGLGSLAAPLLSPQTILEQAEKIRELTQRPFAINLFIQQTPQPTPEAVEQAAEMLKPVWQSFGWTSLPMPDKWCEEFAAQFDALITARPAVASFTFSILTREQVERLHAADIFVVGTATNVAEAQAWEQAGADAVCAQGIEAGGHRGTFIGAQDAGLGTMALVPQVADAIRLPVIAAGGIMDGRGIAAAFKLGAQAVQIGTAFLTCEESGIHPAYKQRLIDAANAPAKAVTRLTRTFSGRYARGLVNRFVDAMQTVEQQLPAYPVQNALTGSIRAHAGKIGDTELMSLWAGQGVAMSRAMPAAELIAAFMSEIQHDENTDAARK